MIDGDQFTSPLAQVWIDQGGLTYTRFLRELKRLGYISTDHAKWLDNAVAARGVYEYLMEAKLIPARDIVHFFRIFKGTFQSSFNTARSLQCIDQELIIDCLDIFRNIFDNVRKTY